MMAHRCTDQGQGGVGDVLEGVWTPDTLTFCTKPLGDEKILEERIAERHLLVKSFVLVK
jgi:hypothetical protein